METKDAFNKIVLCLDCDQPRVKIAIYDMFATICLTHEHLGHK